MAITYDAPSNTITVTGYTEGSPCTFNDLWTADKAGSLSLHDRDGISAVDGAGVVVDEALRPTDYIVLGGANGQDLYIVVENWTNMTTADIRITGTDRDGQAQTEDITITGDGTYYATKWYKTVTHTHVTVFTKSDAGSFDYELTQGQWGVIWKVDEQFRIDCRIIIGNVSDVTWLIDTEKQVMFTELAITGSGQKLMSVKQYGHVRFGVLDDADLRLTSRGVDFLYTGTSYYAGFCEIPWSANVTQQSAEFYSCSFDSIAKSCGLGLMRSIFKVFNCIFKHYASLTPWAYYGTCEVYNCHIFESHANRVLGYCLGSFFDKITIYGGSELAWTQGNYAVLLKNTYIRGLTTRLASFYSYSGNAYFINVDSNTWSIRMYGTDYGGIVYRQYEFNRIILKEDGTPYVGKSWTLKDKDGNTVASGTTQADGKLSATDLVVSYSSYTQAGGLAEHTPFDLWVDGETDYLDLNIYKIPLDVKDVEGVETMVSISDLIDHMTDIKGTNFQKDTHSLVNIKREQR